MKKAKKRIITFKEALDCIPQCRIYCDNCPYFNIRKFNMRKWAREAFKAGIEYPPCNRARTHTLEYCSFLQRYLWIQDGVKDCGINVDEYYLHEEVPHNIRIDTRETADKYKERFPKESKLIDQIVKEDHVHYYNKENEKDD